jgi:FPC/CPF motif-containing protein YcgG
MATENQQAHAKRFIDRIGDEAFPCVGAKSAIARDGIRFFEAGDLRAGDADARLLRDLQAFALGAADGALFTSFVALFPRTPALDEVGFEQALWQRLQALHDLDALDHGWDASVSNEPDSPHFSMSIGGRAFYVIGMHPGSSRQARRFHCAALVFNLHSQFEKLREDGRYDKLRECITERDVAFSGSRNPMLAVHGEASEARQYSGREVGAAWRCPFSATHAN